MNKRRTIVLVLRSGGDFAMRDVELIVRHINGKWKSPIRPRIICLCDKVTAHYDLGNFELMPLGNTQSGTWSRIALYSPEMEQYRPFLYIDLDTAVIQSLENIFDLVEDDRKFIALEDFWRKGQLATGLVWVPARSEKVKMIWEGFKQANGRRMDYYIQAQISNPDMYWQQITNTILDFKPRPGGVVNTLYPGVNLICFHGKPRIFEAGESSISIAWIKNYIHQVFTSNVINDRVASIIIPYNKDRGWLQMAVDSIPENAQLILSKGNGNWPQNFNKALDQVECDYVRWLHEDDMLTPNCIDDSVAAILDQEVDFIHGNAYEIRGSNTSPVRLYKPSVKLPTIDDLMHKNVLHSATMMYRREVFEKVGMMNESLNSAEEFEFNLRCLKAGLKIGYCDAPLAYYRRHDQQKVRTVPIGDKQKEREFVKALYR